MGAGHDHGVQGSAPTGDHRRRLLLAFGITATIVVVQAVGAWITGSLALLTDTAHAFTDAAGLAVALIAGTMMVRPASARKTWGFRRLEVIAALGQASLLLAVGLYAGIEGISRLFDPPTMPASELLVFGVLGLAANMIAIGVLASRRQANFNMRAAFLEVLNDALGSLGVIVAAIVIATTGFYQADALAGLFIAVLIVPRAVTLIRQTLHVLMEFTPAALDLDAVRAHILDKDHVRDVHDLHASTVGTGLEVLSAHVVVDDECFEDGHAPYLLTEIKECLAEHFPVSIEHSTIQIETPRVTRHESGVAGHA